jgi:hypothetical protein
MFDRHAFQVEVPFRKEAQERLQFLVFGGR